MTETPLRKRNPDGTLIYPTKEKPEPEPDLFPEELDLEIYDEFPNVSQD